MRLACASSKITRFRFSLILEMKKNYCKFGVTISDCDRGSLNNSAAAVSLEYHCACIGGVSQL